MTEPERAKHLVPVAASAPELESSDEDSGETPMLAVWISLVAILVAGLYGLYLGTTTKSKPKSDAAATSAYALPMHTRVASATSLDWTKSWRPS